MSLRLLYLIFIRLAGWLVLLALLYWRCCWTGREIAEALRITEGAVTSQLHEARKRIRDELGPEIPSEFGRVEEGIAVMNHDPDTGSSAEDALLSALYSEIEEVFFQVGTQDTMSKPG